LWEYQNALKSLYPKDKPLRRCSYDVPSLPITALALDAFAVRNQVPLGYCDNLVRMQAVPTGEIICLLDRPGNWTC
jgi:hypothetical protein